MICRDCGKDLREIFEYHYVIKNEVWFTFAKSHERLCIFCAEKRLKRRLTPDDFTNESINRKSQFKKSARLLNRLSRKTQRS